MKAEEIFLIVFIGVIVLTMITFTLISISLSIYYKCKLNKYKNLHPGYFENLDLYNSNIKEYHEFYDKNIQPLKDKIDKFEREKLYYTKERLLEEQEQLEIDKVQLEENKVELNKIEKQRNKYYTLMTEEIESDKKFKKFMIKADLWEKSDYNLKYKE